MSRTYDEAKPYDEQMYDWTPGSNTPQLAPASPSATPVAAPAAPSMTPTTTATPTMRPGG